MVVVFIIALILTLIILIPVWRAIFKWIKEHVGNKGEEDNKKENDN